MQSDSSSLLFTQTHCSAHNPGSWQLLACTGAGECLRLGRCQQADARMAPRGSQSPHTCTSALGFQAQSLSHAKRTSEAPGKVAPLKILWLPGALEAATGAAGSPKDGNHPALSQPGWEHQFWALRACWGVRTVPLIQQKFVKQYTLNWLRFKNK